MQDETSTTPSIGRSLSTQRASTGRRGRNKLEEAFLSICRAAELPPDAVNAWIPFPDGGGAEADFLTANSA